MTWLLYVLGVLIFVVGLLLSVGLHELGHLVPGKFFGVKVTQYFIGFGPTLWSRQVGETEYGVKAIPLGGYCKLVGMIPPPEGGLERRTDESGVDGADVETDADSSSGRRRGRRNVFAQLVSDAKDGEYEHVGPEDRDRLFYNQPWWQRVIIMGCGVAINLVLAFLLFASVIMIHGVAQPTLTVGGVSQCVIAATKANLDQAPRTCRDSDPVAPAYSAGMKAGDRFESVNGRRVRSWEQVQAAIHANGARPATIVVDRDGQQLTLQARTIVSTVPDPKNPDRIERTGFLGVSPVQRLEPQGLGYVVTTIGTGVVDTVKVIGTLPVKLYHVGRAALGLEQRDANGPMSVVGAGRVAGEMTSQHQTPWSDRLFSVLALLAGLNLFLGLINLVPLPPFDGGGIATTLYEALRRAVARMFGRPDPGTVDAAKLLPVTYVMATLILVMSLVLIYADIVAPVKLS